MSYTATTTTPTVIEKVLVVGGTGAQGVPIVKGIESLHSCFGLHVVTNQPSGLPVFFYSRPCQR